MENFPGNSHGLNKTEPEEAKKSEKIERVTTGRVLRQKKSLSKRVIETFFTKENSVWQYLLHDILIPAAKDTATDFVSQGMERMVYGEARSTSRRTGSRPGNGYTAYNRFARPTDRRDEPRTMSRRARASHDFEEIVLSTKVEADRVIDKMFLLLEKYNQVTVSDLYDLVGVESTFADERYGWRDLRGAGPTRVQKGYLLDLPQPEALD